MAFDDRAAGHAAQPLLDALTRIGGDSVGTRLHARHVDLDGTIQDDAILATATGEMRRIGAGDQSLRRRAAGVDTGAAKELPLNKRHGHTRSGEPIGERRAGLPGSDNDRVEAAGHGPVLLLINSRRRCR